MSEISRRNFMKLAGITAVSGAAGTLGVPDVAMGKQKVADMSKGTKVSGDIAQVGKRLREGALTSEALTRGYLEKIKQFEPKLNAFITLTADQALTAAAALDAELKEGKDRGPLHGIPIVVKDIYDTAGVKTTVGSKFFENRIPQEDATVVQRLKAAGVVILGKTNMNEFAAGISGQNQFYGDTHNPWDLSRSPGGSSSGTGATISAGLCLGGIGTDTGGSIRVPAGWCSIVGLRPTYGLVSLHGIYPRAYSLDTAGPLARTVADTALLMDAMAGFDPNDRHSSLYQLNGSYSAQLGKGIKGMRIGIVKDYTYKDVDPQIASAVQSAVDTLAKLGARITTIEIPVLVSLDYRALFNNILLYEFNQIMGEQYRAAAERQKIFGAFVQANIETGAKISRDTYKKVQKERPYQIAQVREAFKKVDALITPTLPMMAPPLAAGSAAYGQGWQFTLPFSFLATPCVSVPCGFSNEGLPIGLNIVGNHFEEALILRIAAVFEAATNFHKKHPPLYGGGGV
ncbi:MAG: amidase [Nitrospirota bacterium]